MIGNLSDGRRGKDIPRSQNNNASERELGVCKLIHFVNALKVSDIFNLRAAVLSLVFGSVFGLMYAISDLMFNRFLSMHDFLSAETFMTFLWATLWSTVVMLVLLYVSKKVSDRTLSDETLTDAQDDMADSPKKCESSKDWLSWIMTWRGSLILFAAFVLLWLPYFLAYFPGIVFTDSHAQIFQGFGLLPWSNAHPMAHTAIVSFFMHLGQLFDSRTLGVAFYVFFQRLVMAGGYVYVLRSMKQLGAGNKIIVLCFIFFAFAPILNLTDLYVWKDSLFSMALLIFVLCLVKIIRNGEEFFQSRANLALFCVACFGLLFIRNNGPYIFIPTLLMGLAFLRPVRKQLAITLAVGILALGSFSVAKSFADIDGASSRELFSIPLLQVGRASVAHTDSLSTDQKEFVTTLWQVEQVDDLAAFDVSWTSDYMRLGIDVEYFEDNISDFVSLWWYLGRKYPVDFIDSFLRNSAGYWSVTIYQDHRYETTNRVWRERWEPYLIESWPLWSRGKDFFEGSHADALFTNRSIFPLTLVNTIAYSSFILFAAAFVFIYRRKYHYLCAIVPLFLLWLSCMASPLTISLRYALGLVIAAPLVLVLSLYIKDKDATLSR